ncbi:MAG: FAD-dependent oxidoreductase, partial [Pseudomonadales bacterium]
MTRVIVVGGGNAALCAAIAAREAGAEVALLERAPHALRGGNSRFTAGAMRVVYDGVDDLMTLMPDLSREERERSDFGIYTREQFFDDMANVTRYRCDPDLAEQLVNESLPTLQWMQRKGVRFLPLYHKQAFKIDGKFRFWGGLTIQAWGGGPGLVDSLTEAAR